MMMLMKTSVITRIRKILKTAPTKEKILTMFLKQTKMEEIVEIRMPNFKIIIQTANHTNHKKIIKTIPPIMRVQMETAQMEHN